MSCASCSRHKIHNVIISLTPPAPFLPVFLKRTILYAHYPLRPLSSTPTILYAHQNLWKFPGAELDQLQEGFNKAGRSRSMHSKIREIWQEKYLCPEHWSLLYCQTKSTRASISCPLILVSILKLSSDPSQRSYRPRSGRLRSDAYPACRELKYISNRSFPVP
jgi:hypothetical protein